MFDDKKTSLGDLDECERIWVYDYLHGTSWEEQFECLDDEEEKVPPAWLVEWSKSWRTDYLFDLDAEDLDVMAECMLIYDSNNSKEVWVGMLQDCSGDRFFCIEPLPASKGIPDANAVCDYCTQFLSKIGDYPFIGDLSIHSQQWLPKDDVEKFMMKQMKDIGADRLHGLTLSEWLDREYGDK